MSLKPKMMGSHMSAGGPVATWQPPPSPPGIAGDVRQDNCYCMHGSIHRTLTRQQVVKAIEQTTFEPSVSLGHGSKGSD